MENASKALIIAGAILLSILIIAIGMYIYQSSQNSIQTAATQISAQEIQSFNQTWEMYEGSQTGSNVKALISKLSTSAKSNENEETRLPDLYYEPTSKSVNKGGIVKSTIGSPASLGITNFNKARTYIEPRHIYKVSLVTSPDTALISGIVIQYNENAKADDTGAKAFIEGLEADPVDPEDTKDPILE